VKLLLEAGANPNAVNPNGDTALHIAAHDGKLGPLRELVAGGADVSARNKAGQTALELVETMPPRVLNPIAEMVGIFDDGASPADTAAYLRELLAARPR
jgi:ankyrin repeat protein